MDPHAYQSIDLCDTLHSGMRNLPTKWLSRPMDKRSEEPSQLIAPEWLRIKEAVRFSGLGRSTLYGFIADGTLKSVCVRKRGNIRGIRLIAVDELRRFIEAQVERPLGDQLQ